jgi:hypothetical protein
LIGEYLIRFVVGGLAVSLFSVLGDIFRPRTFAGLFGAAPAVAIATLMIVLGWRGPSDAAIEGRSMILGAAALCIYSLIVCRLLKRYRLSALLSTMLAFPAWFAVALGLYWTLLD